MPNSRRLPASLRYFRARLAILRRPMLWGSASVLLLAVWFLAEYWNYPSRFVQVTGSLPADNLADSADDSATVENQTSEAPAPPALLDPFASVDESPVPATSQPATLPVPPVANPSGNVLDALILPASPQRAGSSGARSSFNSATSTSQNPFVSSGGASLGQSSLSSLPEVNLLPVAPNALPTSASSSAAPNAPDDRAPSSNPLQTALDRYGGLAGGQSLPAPASPSATVPANPAPSPVSEPGEQIYSPLALPRQAVPQPLPGQPSPFQTLSQPQYLPQTSPPPGTTGYTLPSLFQSPTVSNLGDRVTVPASGSVSPLFAPPSAALPNSFSPSPTVQPQFSQPTQPAPFSIPRSAPGRSIGGGQINTFSNP